MSFCEKHQQEFGDVCSKCAATDKRKAAKLLTTDEARSIQHALCAMNVIGAPMLQTAIHRQPNFFRDQPETILFHWEENEALAVEVTIYTTTKGSHDVRGTYTSDSKIEHYADQNAFFKAYGLND